MIINIVAYRQQIGLFNFNARINSNRGNLKLANIVNSFLSYYAILFLILITHVFLYPLAFISTVPFDYVLVPQIIFAVLHPYLADFALPLLLCFPSITVALLSVRVLDSCLSRSTVLFFACCLRCRECGLLVPFLCVYYFKCADLLFIDGDVHLNPGPPHNHDFKFMHWNVNSLPAHNFSRIPLIQAHNSIHNFHLIGITETALNSSITDDQLDFPGYSAIRCDLPANDTHGGVLIFHKIDLSVKNRLDLCNLFITIVLELSISRKRLFFVLSYRKFSQTSDEFNLYSANLSEMLQKIKDEKPYCTVLTGDFNAHNNSWFPGDTSDKFGVVLNDVFDDYGLSQLVD